MLSIHFLSEMNTLYSKMHKIPYFQRNVNFKKTILDLQTKYKEYKRNLNSFQVVTDTLNRTAILVRRGKRVEREGKRKTEYLRMLIQSYDKSRNIREAQSLALTIWYIHQDLLRSHPQDDKTSRNERTYWPQPNQKLETLVARLRIIIIIKQYFVIIKSKINQSNYNQQYYYRIQ